MDVVASIEATMAEARRARTAGDVVRAAELLADAYATSTSLDADHSIRSVVGWRRLKALYDLERIDALEHVLSEVLALPEPFSGGSGLRAAEPIARGIWDRLGYGRPTVRRLWQRYSEHWSGQGDRWMAACGRTQLLWDEACAGELERVAEAVDTIACTTPSQFRGGASRHPQASDAATSLFFAQIEQARIAAWASVWGRDAPLARLALELYADALAEAEQPEDYWFVEAAARAEARFGWPVDAGSRWAAAAAALDHPRGPLHRALARSELEPEAAVEALVPHLDSADAAGPEWGVDVRQVLVDAVPAGDARRAVWRREAQAKVDLFGLGVFRRADAAGDRSVG